MDNTDSTSFASILAGVKRLRDQAEGVSSSSGDTNTNNGATATSTSVAASNKRLKSSTLNQTKTDSTVGGGSGEYPSQTNSADHSSRKSGVTTVKKVTIYSSANSKISTGTGKASALAVRHQQQSSVIFSSIQVSSSQKGNPLLKSVTNVSWEYNNKISVDYLISPKIMVLFLSLKYHKLHPEYIHTRFRKIHLGGTDAVNRDNCLKILLCVVDVENHDEILQELNKICVNNDLTLVLCWSFPEAGTYIQFLKQFELNNSKTIKGIVKEDYQSRIVDTFTSINSVNKTDAVNLVANFGSFKNVCNNVNPENLESLQGFGARKISRLEHAITEPFIYNKRYPSDER